MGEGEVGREGRGADGGCYRGLAVAGAAICIVPGLFVKAKEQTICLQSI